MGSHEMQPVCGCGMLNSRDGRTEATETVDNKPPLAEASVDRLSCATMAPRARCGKSLTMTNRAMNKEADR